MWRWHIVSIPLEAGWEISFETRGFDDVLPPGELGSSLYIQFIILYRACIIARPKGVPPKAARPKDGLFRLHASWIYLSYAGFDCLAAILCH